MKLSGGSDGTRTGGLRRDRTIFRASAVGFLGVLAGTNCHKLPWAAVKAYPKRTQLCVFFFSVHVIADLTAETKYGFVHH